MRTDKHPPSIEQASSGFASSETGNPDGNPGDVDKLEKTELAEIGQGKVMPTGNLLELVAEMARKTALAMIQDEIALYRGLIEDTESVEDKLKIVRELSDLKLRSAGIVLANMQRSGAVRLPKAKDNGDPLLKMHPKKKG
jgi:hypothetical protein